MGEDDQTANNKYHTVSIPLNNADQLAVHTAAARLFVREAQLYRLAVHHLLQQLDSLLDESNVGSDLLPLFLELREDINSHLGLKKQQLFKIFNDKNNLPDKFVSMADIELLLLPRQGLQQRLQQTNGALTSKQADPENWLKGYLLQKYNLPEPISNGKTISAISSAEKDQ